jgi:hypothetical protein
MFGGLRGKVTLFNVDYPTQPPVVLTMPGGKIDQKLLDDPSKFREGERQLLLLSSWLT